MPERQGGPNPPFTKQMAEHQGFPRSRGKWPQDKGGTTAAKPAPYPAPDPDA